MKFLRQAALLLPSAFLLNVLVFLLTHGRDDPGFGVYPFFQAWTGDAAPAPESRFLLQSLVFFAPAYAISLFVILSVSLAERAVFGKRKRPAPSLYGKAFGTAFPVLFFVASAVLMWVGERLLLKQAPGSLVAPLARGRGALRGGRPRARSGGGRGRPAGAAVEGGSGMTAAPRPILIVDFGGQYTQLIARRVREARVFSVVVAPSASAEEIRKSNPVGIILSGGPQSVYDKDAPSSPPTPWRRACRCSGCVTACTGSRTPRADGSRARRAASSAARPPRSSPTRSSLPGSTRARRSG